MALAEMQRLGDAGHKQFEFAHIGIVHRTGQVEIGETGVLVAVSAAHRRAAFAAARGPFVIEAHNRSMMSATKGA